MKLLAEVDEFDSKLMILNCLIVIAERMEGQIVPFIPSILQAFTELWDRSEGQNLFRTSIVTILTKLIVALRADSFQLNHVVFPILKQSLDISNVNINTII